MEEAAALLGVPVDADAQAVKRAWRVWARLAHPDAGGDPQHFAELDEARRVLLHPRPPSLEHAGVWPDAIGMAKGLGGGFPIGSMWVSDRFAELFHPGNHGTTFGGTPLACAAALAVLPSLAPPPLFLAAAPAFLAATAWAVVASRAVLAPRSVPGPSADHGHRITALVLLWLPIASTQVCVSIIAGASILPVLPLSALPLAAAVSAVNPGAGLWRPVSGERPPNA